MACTLSKLAKHGYAVKLTENIAKRYANTAIFLDKLFKTKRMFVNMLLNVKVAKDPEIFFFFTVSFVWLFMMNRNQEEEVML